MFDSLTVTKRSGMLDASVEPVGSRTIATPRFAGSVARESNSCDRVESIERTSVILAPLNSMLGMMIELSFCSMRTSPPAAVSVALRFMSSSERIEGTCDSHPSATSLSIFALV